MHTQITITTLGNFFIEGNGIILTNFVSNKTMLLFLYLCMHPNTHTRSNLAALLWSETSDAQALKNLRTILSSLRAELPDFLQQEANTIRVKAQACISVDAQVFSEQAERLLGLLESKAYDKLQTNEIEQVLGLYQGDFLSSINIRNALNLESWVQGTQEMLKQKYLRLLFHFAEFLVATVDYEKALLYAHQLVQCDPLWELSQRQLMMIYVRLNRRNDALNRFEHLQNVLEEELGAEPEAETIQLYESIRQGIRKEAAIKVDIPRITLSSDTIFVKPLNDYQHMSQLLNTYECRLLTVSGIAGVGKTLASLHIAVEVQKRFRDGAVLVSLATITKEEQLACLILQSLNLSSSDDTRLSEKMLLEYLGPREILIILDGYEHLLPETRLIAAILEAAPRVRLIVTSRSALGLSREWLLTLNALKVAQKTEANAASCEAVKLFELQAKRSLPEFRLADSLSDVLEICHLLDGLPFAIVILASWVRHFSTPKILAMLRDDYAQFYSLYEDGSAHHRDFSKLIDSIWENLNTSEKSALAALSIFSDSFNHEAALAVANISMLDFIKLLDKSLVQRSANHRYKLPKLIRKEAYKHLSISQDLTLVQHRFKEYFLGWAEAMYQCNLPIADEFRHFDLEYHNLSNLVYQDVQDKQESLLRLVPCLRAYWTDRGYINAELLREIGVAARNSAISIQRRARGLIELARMFERTSNYEEAICLGQEALIMETEFGDLFLRVYILRTLAEAYSELGLYHQVESHLEMILSLEPDDLMNDSRLGKLISHAYGDLGDLYMDLGDYPKAEKYLRLSLLRWQEVGDTLRVAIMRSNLGLIALKQKSYSYAFDLFSELLHEADEAHNQTLCIIFASHLGTAAMYLGRYALAFEQFTKALSLAKVIQRHRSIANLMCQFTDLAIALNLYPLAAQIHGFAVLFRQVNKMPITPYELPEQTQRETLLRRCLGESYFACYQEGSEMKLNHIVQSIHTLSFDLAKVAV